MRKLELYVPSEVMAEFADELASKNLSNSITGTTEDGEVVIEVEYERDETDEVDELETALEKLCDELEEEQEEQEEEEEEDNR